MQLYKIASVLLDLLMTIDIALEEKYMRDILHTTM